MNKEQEKQYQKLLDMELNDTRAIQPDWGVIRVPGGWIYRTRYSGCSGAGVAQTFVPEVQLVDHTDEMFR